MVFPPRNFRPRGRWDKEASSFLGGCASNSAVQRTAKRSTAQPTAFINEPEPFLFSAPIPLRQRSMNGQQTEEASPVELAGDRVHQFEMGFDEAEKLNPM